MIKYLFAVLLIAVGTIYASTPKPAEKQYTVSHTQREWVNDLEGKAYVLQTIKQSNIPANVAFICDSIINAQSHEISVQVGTVIQAEEAAKHKVDSAEILKKHSEGTQTKKP